MSLNRATQSVYDYIRRHPDELRHWQQKVVRLAAQLPNQHVTAETVTNELRAYSNERAGVVPLFQELRQAGALERTGLRPLAELMVQLWAPPPVKKKTPADGGTSLR